jgi:hypothetical protein
MGLTCPVFLVRVLVGYRVNRILCDIDAGNKKEAYFYAPWFVVLVWSFSSFGK